MPAFANFARTHIGNSEFFKSLASLLKSRKSGDPSPEWGFDSLEQSETTKRSLRTTFGGTRPPRAAAANRKQPDADLMETDLSDVTEMDSRNGYYTSSQVNVAAPGHEVNLESGITRTREVEQSYSPLVK